MSRILGRDPNKIHRYVPIVDRDLPEKDQLVLLVEPLSPEDNAKIRDKTYKATGLGKKRFEQFLTGSTELEVIIKCLKGWENFMDTDGNNIPFNAQNIGFLPGDILSEVANFARGIVDEDEEQPNYVAAEEEEAAPAGN